LFYRQNGFISHYKLKSGDDDLFVNAAATSKNTKIMISHQSHTVSEAKKTFTNWIIQKRRHLTSGKRYKSSTKLNLGIYSFSQLVFFATFAVLVSVDYTFLIVYPLFVLRLSSQLIIFKRAMIKLNEKNLFIGIPFFEIFFIIFNPLIVIYNTVSKPDKWK
jgi:hypothetical protein